VSDLCLIVGAGRLPRLLAAAHPEARVLGLEGFAEFGETFRLERLGTVLARLRAEGIRRVCLAGSMRRPVVDPARLDAATRPLAARLAAAMAAGDDGALRVVIALLEEAGLDVVGAAELLPDLLAGPGPLGAVAPNAAAEADAGRASAVLAALAPVDVGQGCVVAGGHVLAVEALPGTDWMLAGVADLRRAGPPVPAGGLLLKRPKPGQDRRVDLPAIGPDTVALARRAGLSGIAVEAGGVLVLDRAEAVAAADAAGLFLWGVA
jgi:UDP-2,3-diacylglucosamine hydrolase